MSDDKVLSIKKTMLIIKSEPNSLRGVEQFLKNREWHLKSTSQLKEAILFLVQHKPSFVLISVDHPNRKVLKMPRVLSASFPCCVMVYAEKSTTNSFKALLDSGVEYKINPPITGPAIERAVNKYIRDQEQAAKYKDPNSITSTNLEKSNFDFQVEVKSGSEKGGAGFVSMNLENSQGAGAAGFLDASTAAENSIAQKLLSQLGGLDDEPAGVAGVLKGEAGESFGSEKAKGQDSNTNVNSTASLALDSQSAKGFTSSPEGTVLNFPAASGRHPTDKSLENPLHSKKHLNQEGLSDPTHPHGGSLELKKSKGPQKNRGGESDVGSPHDEPDVLIGRARNVKINPADQEEDKRRARELYVPTNENKKSGNPTLTPEEKEKEDIIFGQEIDDIKSRNARRDPQAGENLTSRNTDSVRSPFPEKLSDESILVRGVVKTIEDSVEHTDRGLSQTLEDNTHLACIIVESNRFSGYLVAALGKDKKIDDQFVELIRNRLMKFLKDNGEPVEHDQNMQIKVKRVDFEGWALEYAQFLKKSVHRGDEVAMAFFPFADAQTKVGESASQNMVSVKTEEIKTEVALEFNLYIYLPSNKKYILYTPEKGKFLEEQKIRLLRQGVHNLHIKKEDVQNLSKFKAQNHLNSLIDHYEGGSKKKRKIA